MAVALTSTGTFASNAAGFTLSFGAGATAGDFGVLIFETANQVVSAPAGWSDNFQQGFGTGGAAAATLIGFFTKTSITAGDIASGIAFPDSGDHQCGVLLTFSGVDATTPFVITQSGQSTSTSNTAVALSTPVNTTTITANDIAIAAICTDRDSSTVATVTSPAWANIAGSRANIVNGSTSTGAGGGIIIDKLVPSGSQTSAVTFSATITASAYTGRIIVLKASSGAQTLTPSLFTNSQSFFAPTVAAGSVTLTPSLFTNSQSFFIPTVLATYSLTPSLFTNNQSFFSPVVAAGGVTLTPSLFTNSQSFYSATVAPGAVTLTPNLFTSSQSFFVPIVSPGTVTLLPSLVMNVQSFFSPTIVPGDVALLPSLFTNSQAFFSPTVFSDQFLLPSLFTNSQSFFSPTASPGTVTLLPDLFTNSQNFFSPSILATYQLLPSLFTNSQIFFDPTVTQSLDQDLFPSLFTNNQSFYSPTILPGEVTLLVPLVTNSQIFYSPSVAFVVFVFVGESAGFARNFMKDFAG